MSISSRLLIAERPASNDQIQRLLEEVGGSLPQAYLDFLRSANGAEGGPSDIEGDSLRVLPSTEVLGFNEEYGIFEDLPALLCFASDGGDNAFAFDRSSSEDADRWKVVLKPLGSPFSEDLIEVADSFARWSDTDFCYDHH